MRPEELVEFADGLYHDTEFSAPRAWRERNNGRKAIGYLPIYAPRELIDAAGMLPSGSPRGVAALIEIIRGRRLLPIVHLSDPTQHRGVGALGSV
jgi:benzoyl-CoA reductase subunit C